VAGHGEAIFLVRHGEVVCRIYLPRTRVNRGRSPHGYPTTSRWCHCSNSHSLSSSKGPAGTLRASARSTVLVSLGT
jgi:hypothetical protein